MVGFELCFRVEPYIHTVNGSGQSICVTVEFEIISQVKTLIIFLFVVVKVIVLANTV